MDDAALVASCFSTIDLVATCFSTFPSGAVTPSVEEVVGGQGGGAGDQPWKFVTFASSNWVKLSEELLQLSGQPWEGEQWKRDQAGFDELRRSKAQFAERFTVIRGKIQFEPNERVKLNDVAYATSLPCDDAESQSDNFVSIFDGVGSLGVWSGKFARYLAQFSKKEADVDQLPASLLPGQNRSDNILQEAHAAAFVELKNKARQPGGDPQEVSGASTAVVLSLVSRPGDKHALHQYVYGDSRWALLRNEGGGYKCLYISPEMVVPGTEQNANPTPLQLEGRRKRHNRNKPPPIVMESDHPGEHGVLEDDVIIAGSDGLFDNLILLRQPPGAQKFRRPTPTDDKLRKCLEEHVSVAVQACKGRCAVCKEMNKGGVGGRASVLCIGESIQRVVASNMARGGKPDDLTIFVTRVSMGSLPDLPKKTCTDMKVASTLMQRQEGAVNRQEGSSAWHDKGICAVLAGLDKDSKGATARKIVELNAAHERLRQAVVDPGGYRTFETCHVRHHQRTTDD